ncbi:hypothetical protein M885DRAFT_539651 [Pelagophyceae sp. CCMP2097]|nr:hypothetical protein M885DRAFT_539651 [Pelagophyceae sp. CCMP2097]
MAPAGEPTGSGKARAAAAPGSVSASKAAPAAFSASSAKGSGPALEPEDRLGLESAQIKVSLFSLGAEQVRIPSGDEVKGVLRLVAETLEAARRRERALVADIATARSAAARLEAALATVTQRLDLVEARTGRVETADAQIQRRFDSLDDRCTANDALSRGIEHRLSDLHAPCHYAPATARAEDAHADEKEDSPAARQEFEDAQAVKARDVAAAKAPATVTPASKRPSALRSETSSAALGLRSVFSEARVAAAEGNAAVAAHRAETALAHVQDLRDSVDLRFADFERMVARSRPAVSQAVAALVSPRTAAALASPRTVEVSASPRAGRDAAALAAPADDDVAQALRRADAAVDASGAALRGTVAAALRHAGIEAQLRVLHVELRRRGDAEDAFAVVLEAQAEKQAEALADMEAERGRIDEKCANLDHLTGALMASESRDADLRVKAQRDLERLAAFAQSRVEEVKAALQRVDALAPRIDAVATRAAAAAALKCVRESLPPMLPAMMDAWAAGRVDLKREEMQAQLEALEDDVADLADARRAAAVAAIFAEGAPAGTRQPALCISCSKRPTPEPALEGFPTSFHTRSAKRLAQTRAQSDFDSPEGRRSPVDRPTTWGRPQTAPAARHAAPPAPVARPAAPPAAPQRKLAFENRGAFHAVQTPPTFQTTPKSPTRGAGGTTAPIKVPSSTYLG